jgi:uncharacterized protein (TIGR04255 family)
LVGWLHAAAPARKVYARPPLILALCQVRFTTKLSINNAVSVAPFQDAIQDEYPEPAPPTVQVAQVQLTGPGGQLSGTSAGQSIQWQFSDLAGNWSVVLTPDYVTLETRSYEHFDDFSDRLQRVLRALVSTIKPAVGRRIGLRYINEIRPGHTEWHRVVRSELLGPLSIEEVRLSCSQSFQLLQLEAGDARINLQHGYLARGTTVAPRAGEEPSEEPAYLVDIDMFRDFVAPSSTLPMDSKLIGNMVDSYHATVSGLFRWAVTDEYRASLGELPDVR